MIHSCIHFVFIDSTAQYIQGGNDLDPSLTGIHNEGLRCVVVLIGAYDLLTGLPVAGVVNQPFVQQHPSNGRSVYLIIIAIFLYFI